MRYSARGNGRTAMGAPTAMTTAITPLITWLKGESVGTDQFGNRYFQQRNAPENRRRKRWVVYKGADEASAVPPQWNAWLHHTVKAVPSEADNSRYVWQKPHIPNMTGTPDAYRPAGHTLRGGHRAKATGDYDAWKPE